MNDACFWLIDTNPIFKTFLMSWSKRYVISCSKNRIPDLSLLVVAYVMSSDTEEPREHVGWAFWPEGVCHRTGSHGRLFVNWESSSFAFLSLLDACHQTIDEDIWTKELPSYFKPWVRSLAFKLKLDCVRLRWNSCILQASVSPTAFSEFYFWKCQLKQISNRELEINTYFVLFAVNLVATNRFLLSDFVRLFIAWKAYLSWSVLTPSSSLQFDSRFFRLADRIETHMPIVEIHLSLKVIM